VIWARTEEEAVARQGQYIHDYLHEAYLHEPVKRAASQKRGDRKSLQSERGARRGVLQHPPVQIGRVVTALHDAAAASPTTTLPEMRCISTRCGARHDQCLVIQLYEEHAGGHVCPRGSQGGARA
jgi:hypothetical protein